jgi:RHS repeat-associated protein
MTGSGSNYTITDHDDTVYTYVNAQLTTRTYRNGYAQSFTYNASNQLTSVTDSYNRTLTFTYNSDGTLASLLTPDGTTITYGYTASAGGQNLTSVTYPTSPAATVTYSYGNSTLYNALTQVTDENGNNYLSWTYDAYGRALTSQIGNGGDARITTFSYDDTNDKTTVTNPLGVADTYSLSWIDNIPKITSISRAATSTTAAASESFTYDGNGYMASKTDWNGDETTYTNDSHGDPTQIVEASGSPVARTTTIAYDPTWVHLPDSITTPGLTTSFTYDGSGDVLTKTETDTTTQSVPYSTNGQTRTWTYTWNNFLPASVETPNSNTTSYGFNSSGALTSITDALSHVTSITAQTGGGYPETIVDPNGVTTTLTYDPRQRLISSTVQTSAGNDTTTYTLDPAGQLTTLTLADGSTYTYSYDAAHRVTGVVNNQNESIQYTLDALGDVTQTNVYNGSGGLRYQHSGTFDALGRQLTDVGGMGQTTTYTYDNDGNALTVKDGLNHTTTRVFDALNRLSTGTDANSGVTSYAYDAHNRVTQLTDANSHATNYVYDGFGDDIQQTSPDTGTAVSHFDSDGNRTKKVDAAGVTVNSTYDALDRITARTYPADSTQNVAFTYDQTGWPYGFGVGRLTTMTDVVGNHYLQYDERGNILGHRLHSNPDGTILGDVFMNYDSVGRLDGYSYPDGLYVAYYEDSIGRVNKMTMFQPNSSTEQSLMWPAYEPFGPMYYLTFADSENAWLGYDLDNRTNMIDYRNSSEASEMDLNYSWDADNNVTGITDTVSAANDQTLGYDVLDRLTSATSGSGGYGSLSWAYDKVGNLTASTAGGVSYSYALNSGTNQLSGITWPGYSESLGYTANGNINSISVNGTSTFAGTYNVANRLVTATGGSLAITGETYDGLGLRYSKTDSGSSPITYFYDPWGHLMEEDNSGEVTDYIYLDGKLVALYVPGSNPPTTGAAYYVHDNLQGAPVFVTDNNQNIVWSMSYQPYGVTSGTGGSVAQNLRFPGQYNDAETGFNYNVHRDYMPNLGRYLEADPIGLKGGMNLYLYASANPERFVDPAGLVGTASNDNNPGPMTVDCYTGYQWCRGLGGGFTSCGRLLAQCHQGIPTIFGPNILGPSWQADFTAATRLRGRR